MYCRIRLTVSTIVFTETDGAAGDGVIGNKTAAERAGISDVLREWDLYVDKNPNAETFVNVDPTQILRHTAYVGGHCFRQLIQGPLGKTLAGICTHIHTHKINTCIYIYT